MLYFKMVRPLVCAVSDDFGPLGVLSKVVLGGDFWWRIPGGRTLYATRDEAGLALESILEKAAAAVSALLEREEGAGSYVDAHNLEVKRVDGSRVVVEYDHGEPEHEGMHPDDCERELRRWHVDLNEAVATRV